MTGKEVTDSGRGLLERCHLRKDIFEVTLE